MNVCLPSFPYAIIRLNNLSAIDVDVFIVAFPAVTSSIRHRQYGIGCGGNFMDRLSQ